MSGKKKRSLVAKAMCAKIQERESAMTRTRLVDDFPADAGSGDAVDTTPFPKRPRPPASDALLTAAFDAVTSPSVRRRLISDRALAVVLLVPTSAWVPVVSNFFKKRFGGDRWERVSRDGSSRTAHRADVGSNEVAARLADGKCIVGIAADIGVLPRALVSGADITIKIPLPDAAVLEKAITRFTGRRPTGMSDRHAAGLDVHEVLAAFRSGSSAQAIAQRLASASVIVRGVTLGENLPSLTDSIEYGAAREWGLQLSIAIADVRAGLIDFSSLPRGVVLEGPPGVGKSRYAGILATECRLPVVRTTVSEWFASGDYYTIFKQINAIFAEAAALAPVILFIDEANSLPNRSTLTNNIDYWKPIINHVLMRLDDAISTRDGIIVVSACNDASDLDPALVRPGRLEKIIRIDRPDMAGTENILRYHARDDLTGDELRDVAVMIEGATGAEVMALVREGRRIARADGRPLRIADLRTAWIPHDGMSADAVWRIAVHEAGHAIGSLAIPHGVLVRCVIGSSGDDGGGGGHTKYAREPDEDLPTLESIEDRVVVSLCGRAAERIVLGVGSLGDRADLESSTRAIAMIHGQSGLGETVSYLGGDDKLWDLLRTDRTFRRIVERNLRHLEARADALMRRHRNAVIAVARELSEKRFLSGDRIRAIFAATLVDETTMIKKGRI